MPVRESEDDLAGRLASRRGMLLGPALRRLGSLLLLLVPGRFRAAAGRRLLGWEVASGARVGLSLIMAGRVRLGPGAYIGHLNVVRAIDFLELGESAKIGDLNWIGGLGSGASGAFGLDPDRRPGLVMGAYASMTSRHLVDCCDLVEIGAFTTVAGAATQIVTHGIDVAANRQRAAPVRIGHHCYVGTASVITKDAALPDCCVLGAASLLNKAWTEEHRLYAGVPARPIKVLPADALYFARAVGRVA